MRLSRVVPVAALAAALALATPGFAAAPALNGTQWRLVQIGGKPATGVSTLVFETGKIAGMAACNSYGGTVTVDAASIRFGQLFSTRKFCQGRMQEEAVFLAALDIARGYRLEGTTLVLTDGSGATLLSFTRRSPRTRSAPHLISA